MQFENRASRDPVDPESSRGTGEPRSLLALAPEGTPSPLDSARGERGTLSAQTAAPDLAPAHFLELGDGWTPALRAELEAGLSALPLALRDFPGGPLELELHAAEAPFGMGDGSTALPDWTDGHRRFHLYAIGPTTERRATWRLEQLTEAQREQLWRRRAVIHAVMQRWEDRLNLARRPAWRSLNGWLAPFERPFTWTESALNLADAAFSRARGKQSAALDLLTFAEEHFVPVESLNADALNPDDTIRCQEFSKRRVLEQLLSEAKLVTPGPRGPCPTFEAWADLERLDQLEVLLVQASGRAAQSLFGHVLLRPVHREEGRVRGPSFDSAIQLAALTNPETGVKHLATGIFGGYRMTVFTVSWRDFEREMLEDEQRSMRRFKLQLTKAQERQVLERSWELERRGEFQYQFFSDNCAAGLQWLLQSALGETLEVAGAGRFIVAPGSVIDGLADARLDGHRLLARLNDDLESTTQRAERSEMLRRTIEARVLSPLPPSEAKAWSERFDAARSPDPAVRVASYVALQHLTRANPQPALYDWWALTVRIERPLADRADETLRSLNRRTALPGKGAPYDHNEELANRQKLFEKESQLQRHWMMLDRAEQVQQRLAELEHRPLVPSEQEEQDAANAALAAFDQLTAIHGQVVSEQFPAVDAQAWLENDRVQKTGAQAVIDADSLPQSGHWRTVVGGGAWVDRAGGVHPVVSLQSSGLAELLGDQRVRGFQSSSELRILDTEVVLAPHLAWEWPEVVQSKFTLFAFRSIKRELPMANDSRLAKLGWGMSLDTDFRAGRTIPSRTSVGGELIAIGGHDRRFTSYFTGALGLSAFLGWGDGPFAVGLSPYAVLSARAPLGGHGANAVRVEAKGQLGVAPTRAQRLMPELLVTASVEWVVGQPGGFALLLKPQAWLHSEPGPRPVQVVGVLGLELL